MSELDTPFPLRTVTRISHLIGLIYDCVLEPSNWQATVDAIRTEMNFCYAILAAYPLPSGTVLLNISSGIDVDWLARLPAYGDDIVATWGGNERILQFPLEEPIVQSHAVPLARLQSSRFYTEWIRPQGVRDAIAIGLERSNRMVSTLSFGRHDDSDPVTEHELALLRIIAPHIRRALAISQILDIKKIEAESFISVVDGLGTAVVVTDETLRVIHANAAAQAMLRDMDPILIRNTSISLRSANADVRFRRAVNRTMSHHGHGGRESGSGICAPRADGPPCIVHVLPLSHRDPYSGVMDRAAFALFISDSAVDPSFPVDALAALYELTPAELRVLELVAGGRSIPKTAQTLGVAPATAKSHLLHVFAKTGCRTQSELVHLMSRLTSPIGKALESAT